MANLFVSEYSVQGLEGGGKVIPAGKEPALVEQRVVFSTSAQSAAFNERTNFIRVQADANAHIAFGLDPTAEATNKYLVAGVPEYFAVSAGHKIAAYDGAS